MTAEIAQLLSAFLSGILPLIGTFTTGGASSTIAFLEGLLPLVQNEIVSVAPIVQNVITELQGSGAVTADQLTALNTLSAQYDAAFEAAATADGFPAPAGS